MAHRRESGFTLIELLIVVTVMPLLIGALAVGLISVMSLQTSVSTRIADSSDAQVVSATFVPDVQASVELTTQVNQAQCGGGTQVLGLESDLSTSTNQYQTVITYAFQQKSGTWVLVRNYCSSGVSATPDSTSIIAFNLVSNLLSLNPLTISPTAMNIAAGNGWVSSQSVVNVSFALTEPEKGSNYTYKLTAVPAMSSPPSTAGAPIVVDTNTTCGFAATENGTVFNGTYASTLCFVDFSSFSASAATYPACQSFVAQIPGGDTLSFCMSESGNQPVFASALPTYPEAFLGNVLTNAAGVAQPFYTGMGCPAGTPATTSGGGPTPSCIKPAVYQTNTGFGPSNTITVTNISVTTATGVPATGWEFVSADAETTDSNEYITWTSNQPLNLLQNSSGSPYGNTCNNLPNWNGPQGLGTTQVTCQSGSQETSAIKTGTPMVEALTPTSMTVTMKGAGLEGVAVGLLIS